ncbi:OmpA/MotB domain-containing protein [Burkholderia lata]|uniref:OmpA family protein n=1 Tax=Burkholderia lata (strain ATCC 17760 / DSM 23089 / LMG 22485 / NCIMB 9086 / R18194 / 383) TaxID=482957 RepID=UPI001453E440|nr:OmpA family protein [Burkholderia lata]VWD54788.1 OmpA/MotB domain-containing protein [Burkholderia lata]
MKLSKTMKHLALFGAVLMAAGTLPATAQTAMSDTFDSAMPFNGAGTRAGQVFGSTYAPVGTVASNQTQIVYYRPGTPTRGAQPAHVYVDDQFQTALLPGGYTTFCVVAGEHTIGAYQNDAPLYKGKSVNRFSANLQGGKTYFLKVQEGGNGAPQALPREQAERELVGLRDQVHALPRASSVQACQTTPLPVAQPAAQPQYKDYTLSGDLLFAFGKSGYGDITGRGREAVGRLVEQMRAENTTLSQITVIGHADQIGSDTAAEELGMRRAATVRRMLVERGLPASKISTESAGNSEPVVEDCRGSKQQLIACYAPNRRVVVRVDAARPA